MKHFLHGFKRGLLLAPFQILTFVLSVSIFLFSIPVVLLSSALVLSNGMIALIYKALPPPENTP